MWATSPRLALGVVNGSGYPLPRNAHEAGCASRKNNGAVRSPCHTRASWGQRRRIADGQRGTTRYSHARDLGVREEAEPPAIGRKEGRVGAFGALDRPPFELVQPPDVQPGHATGPHRDTTYIPLWRNGERRGQLCVERVPSRDRDIPPSRCRWPRGQRGSTTFHAASPPAMMATRATATARPVCLLVFFRRFPSLDALGHPPQCHQKIPDALPSLFGILGKTSFYDRLQQRRHSALAFRHEGGSLIRTAPIRPARVVPRTAYDRLPLRTAPHQRQMSVRSFASCPSSCSGAMYSNVPRIAPVRVSDPCVVGMLDSRDPLVRLVL